jgi:hypothetical protein
MQSSFTPSDEERRLIALFRRVIITKRNDGEPGWKTLSIKFGRWSDAQQLRWIYWIEEQAKGSNPTALAATLMSAVTAERLKG